MPADLANEIFERVSSLPSQEQLVTLLSAFLRVSEEELARGWNDGNFKEVQIRQLKMIDNLRNYISGQPDLNLLADH